MVQSLKCTVICVADLHKSPMGEIRQLLWWSDLGQQFKPVGEIKSGTYGTNTTGSIISPHRRWSRRRQELGQGAALKGDPGYSHNPWLGWHKSCCNSSAARGCHKSAKGHFGSTPGGFGHCTGMCLPVRTTTGSYASLKWLGLHPNFLSGSRCQTPNTYFNNATSSFSKASYGSILHWLLLYLQKHLARR